MLCVFVFYQHSDLVYNASRLLINIHLAKQLGLLIEFHEEREEKIVGLLRAWLIVEYVKTVFVVFVA